jgi:hypothetical protein
MMIDTLRTFHRAIPFQPFVIHLVDGRSIDVACNDFMAIASSERRIAVCGLDDALTLIDVQTITNIECQRLGH